jgi:mono/diheme cytochrome c family protein
MRRVSTLFAIVALIGFHLTAGSSAERAVTGAVLEPQQKPVAQKKPITEKNPIPTSETSVKAGMLVYANACRPCHGLQARGDGVAPPPGSRPANLVDDTWDHGSSDAEIFKTIKEGVAPDYFMQAWGERISDEDIWNAINYLRDLAKRAKAKK